ncbi:MAG: hypothetical protein OXH90_10680 [Paracoccaceae bacterium]|nr:hypothetical protein [Paracoccaceae bacterium]MDE2917221.1 hypothetical protein [Paracoccaceae bacterium]
MSTLPTRWFVGASPYTRGTFLELPLGLRQIARGVKDWSGGTTSGSRNDPGLANQSCGFLRKSW